MLSKNDNERVLYKLSHFFGVKTARNIFRLLLSEVRKEKDIAAIPVHRHSLKPACFISIAESVIINTDSMSGIWILEILVSQKFLPLRNE